MKTKFLFLTILAASLLSTPAFAQSIERNVVGSAGASGTGTGISVDYTIGETIVQTATAGSTTLTQGFHQPASLPVSIDEVTDMINYSVFPNPFADVVQMEFTIPGAASVQLSILDITGRIVYETIPVQYNPGIYILTVNTAAFVPGSYVLAATVSGHDKIPVSVSKKIQLIR